MELWIRSQDREILTKVNLLDISECKETNISNKNNKGFEIWNNIDDTFRKAGTYKTKERALEILDEIQFYLRAKNELFIYEMPKE